MSATINRTLMQRSYIHTLQPLVAGIFFAIAAATSSAATVECSVSNSSETRVVRLSEVASPYDSSKINFDNGFRFTGQLLKSPNKLKTYGYYESKQRYVLIHQAEWNLEKKLCNESLGKNTIYSPRLESALTYECKLICE